MYRVKFTRTAYKNYKHLPDKYQKQASRAIDRLAQNPDHGIPLKGRLKGYSKLRFSNYRIIYRTIRRQLIIIIFDVKHRKDVYRR